MEEIIFIVEESLDGGYEAKALGTSIFTEAESLQDLRKSIREAVRCHFDDDDNRTKVITKMYRKFAWNLE